MVVAVTAEKDDFGPMDVNQVKLGNALLTEIDQQVVGPSSDFHNIVWLGYLNEAGIAGRTGDSTTVTWANASNDPFGQPEGSRSNLPVREPESTHSRFFERN